MKWLLKYVVNNAYTLHTVEVSKTFNTLEDMAHWVEEHDVNIIVMKG